MLVIVVSRLNRLESFSDAGDSDAHTSGIGISRDRGPGVPVFQSSEMTCVLSQGGDDSKGTGFMESSLWKAV